MTSTARRPPRRCRSGWTGDGMTSICQRPTRHSCVMRWPPTLPPLVGVRVALAAAAHRHPRGRPGTVSRPRRSGNGRGPTGSPSPTVAVSPEPYWKRMGTATNIRCPRRQRRRRGSPTGRRRRDRQRLLRRDGRAPETVPSDTQPRPDGASLGEGGSSASPFAPSAPQPGPPFCWASRAQSR